MVLQHHSHQPLLHRLVEEAGHGLEVVFEGNVLVQLVVVVDQLSIDWPNESEAELAFVDEVVVDLAGVAEHVGDPDGEPVRDGLTCHHGHFLSHVDGHRLAVQDSKLDHFFHELRLGGLHADVCLSKIIPVLDTRDVHHSLAQLLEVVPCLEIYFRHLHCTRVPF